MCLHCMWVLPLVCVHVHVSAVPCTVAKGWHTLHSCVSIQYIMHVAKSKLTRTHVDCIIQS